MYKAIVTDVSKVLIFPKDLTYKGSLNALYKNHFEDKDFNFFAYFELNEILLSFYNETSKVLPIYILTSDIIQDDESLKPYWNNISKIFSASKLKLHKSDPEIYRVVLESINLTPQETIYIDDNETNINVADSVGIKTILFKDTNETIEKVNKLLQR